MGRKARLDYKHSKKAIFWVNTAIRVLAFGSLLFSFEFEYNTHLLI